ncbi:hypothetical protein NLJ89_g11220 [Agrocybe chaxingu]|uniref:Uncharacterized protein n=1 Tax=Agrocybe chaxingu TaxID=84603 RepID=A0A9W8JQC2_9AGAR|nr:hypothetical protein NLJ89_g11220 [Agrocybe chaxingu]
MTEAEMDAKFPGQVCVGYPPSPSIENPGRVFPKTDPNKAPAVSPKRNTPDKFVGNPFLMNSALDKVDHSLGEVISVLEQEERSQDRQGGDNALLRKFRSWRNELDNIRMGEEEIPVPNRAPEITSEAGGMFTD